MVKFDNLAELKKDKEYLEDLNELRKDDDYLTAIKEEMTELEQDKDSGLNFGILKDNVDFGEYFAIRGCYAVDSAVDVFEKTAIDDKSMMTIMGTMVPIFRNVFMHVVDDVFSGVKDIEQLVQISGMTKTDKIDTLMFLFMTLNFSSSKNVWDFYKSEEGQKIGECMMNSIDEQLENYLDKDEEEYEDEYWPEEDY